MNKTELVKNVAQSADISQKDASAAVQSVFDTIANALQSGDKVQLIGFGTFEVRERICFVQGVIRKLEKKFRLLLVKFQHLKQEKN